MTSGEISVSAWQLLFIFSSTDAIKRSTIERLEMIIYKTIYVSITLQILWDNCKFLEMIKSYLDNRFMFLLTLIEKNACQIFKFFWKWWNQNNVQYKSNKFCANLMLLTALYKDNYVSKCVLYWKVIMMSEIYYYAQNSKQYWESDMIFIEDDKTNMFTYITNMITQIWKYINMYSSCFWQTYEK